MLTDDSGLVTFDQVVFYGARGQRYRMVFTTPDATEALEAELQVQPCREDEFVVGGVGCQACPDGARCNGTATLEALPNFWRTGWYDAAGEYHPNTEEYRFLRCPNAACLGGAASDCTAGATGVLCGECEARHANDDGVGRCRSCLAEPWADVLAHVGLFLMYLCLVGLLVFLSVRGLGGSPDSFQMLVHTLVDYVQQVRCPSLPPSLPPSFPPSLSSSLPPSSLPPSLPVK